MSEPLLHARFSAGYGEREVLSQFELTIGRGEIVGLVGESGSGKSTVALALMRLAGFRGGWARGEIRLEGRDLLALPERRMREIRGRGIAFVMQSPMSALNPAMRLGAHFRECARAHGCAELGEPNRSLFDLLETVNLPANEAFLARYPRQVSVGQAQRALIAMAVLHRPKLLIADEPTSALDAVNQARTLQLFSKLSAKLGMSLLFISHDLLSVASLCGRIVILEKGSVVEKGTARDIFIRPRHAYTRTLLGAIPKPAFLKAGEEDKPSLPEVNCDDTMSVPSKYSVNCSLKTSPLDGGCDGRRPALCISDGNALE